MAVVLLVDVPLLLHLRHFLGHRWPLLQSLTPLSEQQCVVANDILWQQIIRRKFSSVLSDLFGLGIVIPGPTDLFQQITEILLERDEMRTRLELAVEVFNVVGLLLKHEGSSSQEEGESVGGYGSVYI